MRVAIMQPYFLPYIGYFQLIKAADLFLVYDNIKYTKKGWINRNRILKNGKDAVISLPLKSDSDSLDVFQRQIAAEFNREKLLNQVREAYRRAPYFVDAYPTIEQIVCYGDSNLFGFLRHSIVRICSYLGITTEIKNTSEVPIDHELKSQDKVIALCKASGADTYINAIGGMDLYSREAFRHSGVELKFIRSKPFEYAQFGDTFVPWLSIADVMMFNSPEYIRTCVSTNYEVI